MSKFNIKEYSMAIEEALILYENYAGDYLDNYKVIDFVVRYSGKKLYIEGNVSDDVDSYECAFDLTKNGEFYRRGCECDTYLSLRVPCVHCATILSMIQDMNIESLPFRYVSHQEDEHIESQMPAYLRFQLERMSYNTKYYLQKAQKNHQNKVEELTQTNNYMIQLEVRQIGNKVGFAFKVGIDKFYVVKNIETFIDAIHNHKSISYGKSFSFVHSKSCFYEDALPHIEFMEYCLNRQSEIMNENYFYNYDKIVRTIPLSNIFLDYFFDTYKDINLEGVELKEEEYKLHLKVEEHGDYYCFNINDRFYLSDDYGYLIDYDGDLYITRIKWDDNGKCRSFIQNFAFELDYQFVLKKEDYPMFYRYVFSEVKDYFDVNQDIELKENVFNQIRIYGDIDDEDVYFEVYYFDDELHRISAFRNDLMLTFAQEVVEKILLSVGTYDEQSKRIYMDLNDERCITFLQEGIYRLQEYGEVYISDALKKLGHKSDYKITVGVSIQNDLLQLNIDSLKIPKMEISEVLAQYKRKKKFYRLKNGEIINLQSPDLEEISNLLDDYHISAKQIKNGNLTLDKNRMFSLQEDEVNFKHIQVERNNSFQKHLEQFYEPIKNITFTPYYDHLLRDYQKEGVKWLMVLQQYGFNGILADDMGLGKTLQVICMLELSELKNVSIVVCPASLIYNWFDECQKFAPNMKVGCVCGSQSERKELIAHASEYQLLVTSYDYLRRDVNEYDTINFDYVILDESQYIKNLKTKNAQSVKQLHGKYRLALSGTPIENTLAELWSVFDFLMPNYLYNYHYFRSMFENKIVKDADEKTSQKLKQLVSPFILRRNKRDVLTELPEKIEMIQKISFDEVEAKLYFANLAQVNVQLQELLQAQTLNKVAILAMMTRLRQICCEPRMIYENIENSSTKLRACLDLIINYKQNGQKVLVFSSFTSVFPLLEEEFHLQGIRYFKITGETNKDLRKKYVEGFQNNEVDVFLISLKAGGTGLNLTAAEAVIHFDPWWNVSAQNQASDRAYRIGQTKKVQVHKLIMKDSIEEKIVQLQEKKQALADAFVKESETSITTLSKEEIINLFK